MGNRTSLTFSDCCQFEANNCLPVTWLALFNSQEFFVETKHENLEDDEDEEYEVAIYRTSHDSALKRIEQVINLLKGQTPVWAFLRPIELIKDELNLCSATEIIELDVTQFWAIDEAFQQKVPEAITTFNEMINGFTGDEKHDNLLLDQLVNRYSLGNGLSIVNMDSEERMFILIGTYWGDPVRGKLYSLEFFNKAYWTDRS